MLRVAVRRKSHSLKKSKSPRTAKTQFLASTLCHGPFNILPNIKLQSIKKSAFLLSPSSSTQLPLPYYLTSNLLYSKQSESKPTEPITHYLDTNVFRSLNLPTAKKNCIICTQKFRSIKKPFNFINKKMVR